MHTQQALYSTAYLSAGGTAEAGKALPSWHSAPPYTLRHFYWDKKRPRAIAPALYRQSFKVALSINNGKGWYLRHGVFSFKDFLLFYLPQQAGHHVYPAPICKVHQHIPVPAADTLALVPYGRTRLSFIHRV